MSAAHTPGPWIAAPWTDKEAEIEGFSISSGGHLVPTSNLCGDYEEAKANATLIAAAPDMLEALQAALAELERANRAMRQEAGVTVCNEAVLQQVREAIAKAVTA